MEFKIIEAIILGIIQGVTEFIPISSSAHLEVVPWLFNWTEISKSFDLALHIGTLIALIIFFFKEGIDLIKSGFALAIVKISSKRNKDKKSKLKIDEQTTKSGALFWYVILATIPAGLASFVLDKVSESIIGDNTILRLCLIAIASIVMGVLLYIIDKKSAVEKTLDNATLKDVAIVGASQAFAAVFPGVSRSGITITLSRGLKYDRKDSAKLSFFLSIPMILAAVVFKFKEFDFTYPIPFFTGIIVSCIVGMIIINLLFKYLQNGNYKVFAIYRVCFGIAILFAIVMRVLVSNS